MNCLDCSYQNGCEGADCYYDYLQKQREDQPDYDEEKYYMVDNCDRCAYTDKVFSKRGINEYREKFPDDDMHSFMTKDEIEAADGIRWDTDDSWLECGKQEAAEIIVRKGIEEVFSWWEDYDFAQLKLKRDIGFYNEIMRQADEAGLFPKETRRYRYERAGGN